MVGDAGFEPATPWTQTKCATKLRQSPTLCCIAATGRNINALAGYRQTFFSIALVIAGYLYQVRHRR